MNITTVILLEELKPIDIPTAAFEVLLKNNVIVIDKDVAAKPYFPEQYLTTVKKEVVKAYVLEMGTEFQRYMEKKLNGIHGWGIDFEDYDLSYDKMLLPKAVLSAMLKDAYEGYTGGNSTPHKWVKKEARRLYPMI